MTWTRTFWRLVGVAAFIQLVFLAGLTAIGPDRIASQWDNKLEAMLFVASTDMMLIQFGMLMIPAVIVLLIGLTGRPSSSSASSGR
jgi:hypothetical protein